MCGIVAYVGHRQAYPIIIKGLKRLEYRGYDSAGIALLNGDLSVYKKKGKVSDLEDSLDPKDLESTIGIGHTRWATHGEPNDLNAHPHYSSNGQLAIIHNGIIENYIALKKELESRGHVFKSQTDSEVFINFIEQIFTDLNCDLEEAVRIALQKVVGAYAIVILDKNAPNQLIAARKGSPMVLGIGDNEFLIASDATPIIEYTKKVVYINDYEIVCIKDGELSIKNINAETTQPYIQELDLRLDAIEKGGFDHFMLKEIFEQPRSIADCLRGRMNAQTGHLVLGGLIEYNNKVMNANRFLFVACGTSWHAALVAEYIFEELTRVPAEVEYASEFRYRNPIVHEGDVIFAISQSGETADTLAAIELAKSKGAMIYGVCNVVGSSIARASHAGSYTHAGPEIGVASTKAFTAQVTVLTMMALLIAEKKGTITAQRFHQLMTELENIPSKVERALKANDYIAELASKYVDSTNALYLGRGVNFPVALEGALKLKEISYIHAEGYPAAEMKHGPIALIDENMPVVVIATQNNQYDKVVSNIQEVRARKGRVIAIVNPGDTEVSKLAEFVIEVPETHDALSPLINSVPLQLLSYHIATLRGCNVDQPRNLAKSVTVE
ncbi:MAG: glutamine--fructose-6-phosphate transaminase (isomerizing) [Flexibacteraceae bacterium]